MRYQVIVGNIGTVYDGKDVVEATTSFCEYKDKSIAGIGRAGGETVTLTDDDEIRLEHIPEDCEECGEPLKDFMKDMDNTNLESVFGCASCDS